jgi:hypothetical protein
VWVNSEILNCSKLEKNKHTRHTSGAKSQPTRRPGMGEGSSQRSCRSSGKKAAGTRPHRGWNEGSRHNTLKWYHHFLCSRGRDMPTQQRCHKPKCLSGSCPNLAVPLQKQMWKGTQGPCRRKCHPGTSPCFLVQFLLDSWLSWSQHKFWLKLCLTMLFPNASLWHFTCCKIIPNNFSDLSFGFLFCFVLFFN